jgi:hypothetical protein
MTPAAAATTFFEIISLGAPVGTALVLSTPRDGWKPHAVAGDDAGTAARIALALGTDTFIAVGLQDAAAVRARTGRGRAADVVALTAVTCDLDIAKLGAKKRYLPDRAAAGRFLGQLPIRPTVIIFSGAGYHLWWCFKEVVVFDTAADRARAERLVWRWQGFLRLHLGGYALDSTHDLARVLRPPGTTNSKYGNLVVLDDAGGPRVDPSELDELCVGVPDVEPPRRAGTSSRVLVLDPAAQPPFGKFATLCRMSPLFSKLWRRESTPKDASQSGFDFRLATLAAAAGWTDSEIVGLLIAHRREAGRPPHHPAYYMRTITAARAAAVRPQPAAGPAR